MWIPSNVRRGREAAALDLAGGRFEVGTPAMVLGVCAAASSFTPMRFRKTIIANAEIFFGLSTIHVAAIHADKTWWQSHRSWCIAERKDSTRQGQGKPGGRKGFRA